LGDRLCFFFAFHPLEIVDNFDETVPEILGRRFGERKMISRWDER
jgi:hypothetical protein